MPDKFLVAGLGNPGPAYAYTRHNAGFHFVAAFAAAQGWAFSGPKMQGLFAQGRFAGKTLHCVQPQTFMNRSGQCLRAWLDYFDIPLANLVVLHDDLDLAPGRIKVARGGGHGGHNGVRSIIEHLGSRDFARIRIGIGRPPGPSSHDENRAADYVLAPAGQALHAAWDERVDLVNEAIECFVARGIEACMNEINGRG